MAVHDRYSTRWLVSVRAREARAWGVPCVPPANQEEVLRDMKRLLRRS